MAKKELIPHLFRTEFGKITAVLSRHFGISHLETAEDIASETFLAAMETWSYKGIPDNPRAWLYAVAKNKTLNHLNRDALFRNKVSGQIKQSLENHWEPNIDLSDANISDSQLRMLFVVCHPSLPPESQIGLALRILCGFGIEEIANAFLTTKDTINKRLYRARKKLRKEQVSIVMPGETELSRRLHTVLKTLYLLFNEGYYSESNDMVLRKELCLEAMRLTYQLVENDTTCTPETQALLALMCFHSSRFEARIDGNGKPIFYEDQDEKLWNDELIARGARYLRLSARGNQTSPYHLEAAIAWWHTRKSDTGKKWENILHLYDQLLSIQYSLVAALNRIYALSKVTGREKAIEEARKLNLNDNPYYYTLLGVLYSQLNNKKTKEFLQKAYSLAGTKADKEMIQKQMGKL